MIGIDTNVLVQFVTHDDEAQWPAAEAVMRNEPVFISDSVLLETGWVLSKSFGFAKPTVVSAGVTVRRPELVARFLDWAERGLDLADAMHLALASECDSFATFDQAFIRLAAALDAMTVRVS